MLAHKHRVRSREFQSHSPHSKSFSNRFFSARLVRIEPTRPPAVSVIVSKKVFSTAVARNRARRRIYSAFGEQVSSLPKGVMVFVYPKKEILTLSFLELKKLSKEIVSAADK